MPIKFWKASDFALPKEAVRAKERSGEHWSDLAHVHYWLFTGLTETIATREPFRVARRMQAKHRWTDETVIAAHERALACGVRGSIALESAKEKLKAKPSGPGKSNKPGDDNLIGSTGFSGSDNSRLIDMILGIGPNAARDAVAAFTTIEPDYPEQFNQIDEERAEMRRNALLGNSKRAKHNITGALLGVAEDISSGSYRPEDF